MQIASKIHTILLQFYQKDDIITINNGMEYAFFGDGAL
jgi:hypothetical protein